MPITLASSGASTRRFSKCYSLTGTCSSGSMSERLDMHRLKAEYTAKRAKRVALAESFVILALLIMLSLEYENNRYMQKWIANNFWPASWLLNGTLVGVMAGLVVGW